jgi:hypothetical protein
VQTLIRLIYRSIIGGVLTASLCAGSANAEDFFFSDADADCAAQIIYINECSGKEQNLLFWSPDEAFPSLGIGHFIWYPANASGPYLESFPAFLDFAKDLGLAPPSWISAMPEKHCPWQSRGEFLRDLNSDRVRELRVFLRDTKREQAQYIIRRFMRLFPRILDDLDEANQQSVREKYSLLMLSREATFAMIDYVNFKGEGLRTDARYDGVGWGLVQVLIEMDIPDNPEKALNEFILAAERVLERRVSHAPRPDVESRWLPGWKNRLNSYSRLNC